MMNVSLKTKLNIMAGTAIVAVLLLTLMGYLLGKNASIGSPAYNNIQAVNVFAADILPPPMFMLEATMQANALASSDASERKELIGLIKKHFQEFNDETARWEKEQTLPREIMDIVDGKLKPQAKEFQDYTQKNILEPAARDDNAALLKGLEGLKPLYNTHLGMIQDLVERANKLIEKANTEGISVVSTYTTLLMSVAAISTLAVIFFSVYFTKLILAGLGADPEELKRITGAVARGDIDIQLHAQKGDGSVMSAVSEMVESLRAAAVTARENLRIKLALDGSSTAFLMCDLNGNINYANDASMTLLHKNESEIRKEFPSFNADKLMGANIDFFHKDPAHQKGILNNLNGTHTAQIHIGTRIFKLMMTPFIDNAGKRMGTVVEWHDLTEEILEDQQKTRILESLDSSSTNLMIADASHNVIYMNKAIKAMMQQVEPDLRKDLPHFHANTIIGSNMDLFHQGSGHQARMLAGLTAAHVSTIEVGKRTFRLTASPIFDAKDERLGTVVEWLDRTAEVAAEKDVSIIVDKAVAGDFSARIPTNDKTGFFLRLAEGLNQLVDTADRGLTDVNRVLKAIAQGDLTETIATDYAGMFGQLKNYCVETNQSVSLMLTEIRSAADTIFTASSEIAQGNADLSSRTEQQAANLEETASSMEELTSTVKLNADNAKQANVLAEQAATVATDGGVLIQEVVATMNAINESSQKIADIIGVIDGIAFQTNILALNAAVEAARAGDQGRGFAVVASEVRTLAQRSANAAKDIKGLISDSVKKIENGNTLVGKSGETMKNIVTAIKRVNDIMAEIAAASSEQSSGIDEISTAVSHMDEMTQQNAALVEEAAAAAESLQSQADQLTQRVAQFRLANDTGNMMRKPIARLAPSNSATPATTTKKLTPPKQQDDEWESF